MKVPRTVNAIGCIEDDLITATESSQKRNVQPWLKWGALAACLTILMAAGAAAVPSLFDGNVATGDTNERYKDFYVEADETAIVWSWEDRTVYEKYTALNLNGTEYGNRGRTVSAELVGESLGTHAVVGYDVITDHTYTADFEVYQLKYADKSRFAAVKMEDVFYVFMKNTYDPPATLGELLAWADLPRVIELRRFSENGGGPCDKHFALNEDEKIWDVLVDCKNAVFVEDATWTVHEREYLSFMVQSETLGAYKLAMYVTADGYLWTNTFSYGYLFDIGEDAAKQIMTYAKSNAEETAYEPYRNTIVGTIKEITDEHLLVDDAVLCKDSTDGITYKVLLNDLRISRYVDHDVVKEGDIVQIAYEGDVDTENANTIRSAVTAEKAILYFEDETEKKEDGLGNGETVTVVTTRKSRAQSPA